VTYNFLPHLQRQAITGRKQKRVGSTQYKHNTNMKLTLKAIRKVFRNDNFCFFVTNNQRPSLVHVFEPVHHNNDIQEIKIGQFKVVLGESKTDSDPYDNVTICNDSFQYLDQQHVDKWNVHWIPTEKRGKFDLKVHVLQKHAEHEDDMKIILVLMKKGGVEARKMFGNECASLQRVHISVGSMVPFPSVSCILHGYVKKKTEQGKKVKRSVTDDIPVSGQLIQDIISIAMT
jgi:hypothetical protein